MFIVNTFKEYVHWYLKPVYKTTDTFVILFIMFFSERPLYMVWENLTNIASETVRKLIFIGSHENVTSTGILCEKGKNGFSDVIKWPYLTLTNVCALKTFRHWYLLSLLTDIQVCVIITLKHI